MHLDGTLSCWKHPFEKEKTVVINGWSWSATICEYTVEFKWCSVGAMWWDLFSKVTFFLFSVYSYWRSHDRCSFTLSFLVEGRGARRVVHALYPSRVLWDIPLNILIALSEFTFVACQRGWTHLATLFWPLSPTMHFCPQNCCCCCQDFFLCFVCAAILGKLCNV